MIGRNLDNLEISCYRCIQLERERDEALADLRKAYVEVAALARERDEALAEISVLATELEEERAAPTEGWVPASAWDKAKTALAVCDACCKERIRERDEAREVARRLSTELASRDIVFVDAPSWLAEEAADGS
jgi:hypothetical protein